MFTPIQSRNGQPSGLREEAKDGRMVISTKAPGILELDLWSSVGLGSNVVSVNPVFSASFYFNMQFVMTSERDMHPK